VALYLVLHHPRDPRPSRWANAWEPGSATRVRAITTTAKIAHDAEDEGVAYIHRCAFEREAATIVAEVRFESAVAIDPDRKGSDYLVQFTTVRTMNAVPPQSPGPGTNSYVDDAPKSARPRVPRR
jgi:hypothetical protein